ncbi:MAG TPA: signal peptidase II [Gemmatimonadaceae bacterium]|nr:signal peptidase II [Gemmatimonadaceae bacterium]
MRRSSNAALFWPVMVLVTTSDFITKKLAVEALMERAMPRTVFGDWFRLALVRNPGAAFGLNVGPSSRFIFMGLTIVALVILARLYRSTREGDASRVIALALVCGGAIGNLIDRVASAKGVIDFIDVGISEITRWPTFNVADMAVSFGAFLLAWVLWEEDRDLAGEVGPVAAASVARESGEV